jgi:hypothetical protein
MPVVWHYASGGTWHELGTDGGVAPVNERHKYDPDVVCPLSNPTLVTLSGTAPGSLSYGTGQDVKITIDGTLTAPAGTSMINITGGRNIHILGINGGKLVETRTSTTQKNSIVRNQARGHTFIDSVHLDSSTAVSVDDFVIRGYAPAGTNRAGWVYPKTWIQNCRIDGSLYTGTFTDPHPDGFQKQTALGSVYLYNTTYSFVYQALLIANQTFSEAGANGQELYNEGLKNGTRFVAGELRFEKVNIYRRVNNLYGPALWIGWNTAAVYAAFTGDDPYPVYFDGSDNWVYGSTAANDNLNGGLVYPTTLANYSGSHTKVSGTAINMVVGTDSVGTYASWVPAANITGRLYQGVSLLNRRPGGDHVTAASLVGYDSPFA